MEKVKNMEQWSTTIKKVDDIPLVKLEPVVMKNEFPTDFVGVMEDKTNHTLGVGSTKYQLVQNRDVYNAILQLKDYKIMKAELHRFGRRMVIEVQPTKDLTVELLPKDKFSPMARIFNSYDGTRAVTVESFGMRLVCTNGMIAPVKGSWSSRNIHIGDSIDLNDLSDNITKAINLWEKSRKTITASSTLKVDSELALFYVGFPQRYRKVAMETLKKEDTVYNVWNEMTRFVSHDMNGSKGKQKSALHGRQIRMQKQANQVFDFLQMPDTQINKLAKELKVWNEKHKKK
jgi:hypothetical protein